MHLSQGGAWRDWGRLLNDSYRAESRSGTRRARNECPAHDADHLQQTTVISQRLAQKMLSDLHQRQWAMLPARTWSPPRTHANGKQRQRRTDEQKCQEATEAETILIDTTRNTVEKTDALKKHRKTVTMRAESLVTAEANFFGTLLDRQEEPQRHLNELSAQRGKQCTAIHSTQ